MKVKSGRLFKALLLLFFIAMVVGVFSYGILVGRYEMFPWSYIRSAQFTLGNVFMADVGEGKRLFESQCSRCHGTDGSGGEGPSLNRRNLKNAATDEDFRRILTSGLGSMPRAMQTTVEEQAQIVAYVRSLGKSAPTVAVNGDPARGKDVYVNAGCGSCHVIDGVGTGFGPELSEIGTIRGPAYLHAALVNPGAALPVGTFTVNEGYMEYLPVRVVTQDGTEVRGIRLSEDTFSIQLLDVNQRTHSFRKGDLREIEQQPGKSLMPSYQDELTAPQIEDLVAFLSNLRGKN